MFHHTKTFEHWQHRPQGGTARDESTRQLLRAAFTAKALKYYRARLYSNAGGTGLRRALAIDLGPQVRPDDPMNGLQTVWIVEEPGRRVYAYGSPSAPSPSAAGGRCLREATVLDPNSSWYRDLARCAAARLLDRLPNRRPAIAGDIQGLEQVERALLGAAAAEFLNGLDQTILGFAIADQSATTDGYNFYWARNGAPDQARTQAAQAYPYFAADLRDDPQLRRIVERRAPLAPALADRYQVQPRTITKCRGLKSRQAPPEHRAAVLKRLDALPVEYLPKTEQDWVSFLALAAPLADLADVLQVDFFDLVKPVATSWHVGHQALARQSGTEFSLAGIFDLMQATYRYGVYPTLAGVTPGAALTTGAVAPPDPPAEFFPLWFSRYGIFRLAEMAARWRDAYRNFSLDRLGITDPNTAARLTWRSIFPPKTAHAHGDFQVIEVTSRPDLELEGREQRHCVASYAVKCLTGDSAIFSIRDRYTGKVCSTFEVGLADNAPALMKHHACQNQAPSAELAALAARFVNQVLGRVPREQIAALRRARRHAGLPITKLLPPVNSHDIPLTPGERNALADAVSFAHPREVRGRDLRPFLAQHGFSWISQRAQSEEAEELIDDELPF